VPGQVFIAAASGGVWKTTDGNDTYETAWPDDLTQAVGALAMTPDGTLFAGTGETNPGGGSLTFGGTGMYRSRDRGESWQRVGLERSGAFGRIVTHPRKSRILYAAASGHLYLPGGQRGVYKSTHGGDSWQRALTGENSTSGASDLAMDPDNPNRLYAVMWDHQRTPGLRLYGGRGSGLYMTQNAGRSWRRVGSAYGLPARSEDIGRMAVAVAPSNARRVDVTAIGTDGRYDEFYVSNNRGRSFSTIDESPLIGQSQATFGWWFGKIFVDPADHEHLFIPGVPLVESRDGGATAFVDVSVHADQHAMQWDPKSPGTVYLGNDGGMYRSRLNGAVGTYGLSRYMPWTQHYTLDVGTQDPTRVVTGLQDQGCIRSYGESGNSNPDTWNSYGCGDGLETLINPVNQNIVYGCSQYGFCNRSDDAGRTSTPIGQTHSASGRRNWLTPLEFDPNDPTIMYYAGNVVDRSTDGGRSWTQISPDLTRGVDEDPDYPFGTITAVAPARSDPNVLYVGTDDGRLWTTKNLGQDWIELTDPVLPDIYVTRTAVSPTNADVAYVTYSGFRQGCDEQHVFKTRDGGESWTDISGNLPAAPVNDLLVAPRGNLVVAQDVGVYVSRNSGRRWLRLGDALPLAPVLDITYHRGTDTITAATLGRGVYRVDLPGR